MKVRREAVEMPVIPGNRSGEDGRRILCDTSSGRDARMPGRAADPRSQQKLHELCGLVAPVDRVALLYEGLQGFETVLGPEHALVAASLMVKGLVHR